MASMVQIHNVPDSTLRALKARAASEGRSLNDYLLELLVDKASRPSVAEALDRSAKRAEPSTASSVDVIRRHRDAG